MAIARGRIDVPGAARPVASPAATSAPNPAKRKMGEAELFEVGCFQPASQREEAEEDTPSDEEAKDELYCVYSTKVVGIQYYRGTFADLGLYCTADASRDGWPWRGSFTCQRASESLRQVSGIGVLDVNLTDMTQEMQSK